jgi:hypothetical protein
MRKQLQTSQKSTAILELDIKNRLRPILQILDIKPHLVTLQNNESLLWADYIRATPKPIPIRISFSAEIKNLGSVPALQVRGKWMQGKEKITRESLKHGKEDPSFPLGVGESYPFTVNFTWDEFLESKHDYYYIGMRIEYDVLDKKEEIGKIFQIKYNTILNLDYWITPPTRDNQ